jgi:hypothetical protein
VAQLSPTASSCEAECKFLVVSETHVAFDQNRIKHMELIQGVVSRLASNSFLIKGWAITVTSGFLGVAVSREQGRFGWIAVAPIVLFGSLDAYFLYAERLFRGLYEQVRQSNPNVGPFFMGATSPDFVAVLRAKGVNDVSFGNALRRPVVWLFYLALLLAAVLVGALSHVT